MRITIFILFVVIIFCACNKIKYYPDNQLPPVYTKFLAHAAGGSNTIYQQNSLQAARYSLPKFSGIEVDLQLSKSRSLWLSHNAVLEPCGDFSGSCYAETYDEEILQLDSCLGTTLDFTKLETIFKLMEDSFPEQYISLDCKEWVPCGIESINVLDVMKVIADEVNNLIIKYNRQGYVLIESEIATYLNYVKHNCVGAETYLVALGDFERGMQLALEAEYSGISFKYNFDELITSKEVELLHKKGLKIQLWTVNSEELLLQALEINPDYIQTDDVESSLLEDYYHRK